MLSLSRRTFQGRGFLPALLASVMLFSAVAPVRGWQQAATATAKQSTATLTSAEKKAADRVKLETIRELTTKLASKEFEGRGTGQPGADKAANYLAEHFTNLGLKPGGDNGTYLQSIKFRSTMVLPSSSMTIGDASLKHGSDYILLPPYSSDQYDVSGGAVFVGYGVVSKELQRDDLADVDLKGKVVIMLGGQAPTNVDAATWRQASNPQAVARNLFGRGAVALIIANAGTPAQPYSTIANYLSRRRVSLASVPAPQMPTPPVLLADNAAMERVFAGSTSTFAKTLEQAGLGEKVSRDLGKTATLALKLKREETTSSNVVGILEGSDPKLKEEAVVYTAHYDAYGIDGAGTIFPGAADNALGTATIGAIAEAVVKAYPKPTERPRRSIIFLAVTGEEYGLLGAEHWVRNPTWPLAKVAANINFDGIGTEVYGPVKRVVGFGAEHSDLGTVFDEVSAATGTIVTPDPVPEENAFVRSDHYAFVKRGVPALMLMGGPAGETSVWIPRMKKWMDTDYHSANDTVKPDWDWTGPRTLAQIGLVIGLRVANAEAMPAWRATSPFNRARGTVRGPGGT
ncbi:MAG TPA: M28 family peptidase [Pyrinomonadaceae bacterium]|nr:M28 family peptidase [Pyrinomonadaceae bacterium]